MRPFIIIFTFSMIFETECANDELLQSTLDFLKITRKSCFVLVIEESNHDFQSNDLPIVLVKQDATDDELDRALDLCHDIIVTKMDDFMMRKTLSYQHRYVLLASEKKIFEENSEFLGRFFNTLYVTMNTENNDQLKLWKRDKPFHPELKLLKQRESVLVSEKV